MEWNPKFDRFVGHFSMYQEDASSSDVGPDRIHVVDSDIGRNVDFERVSPHHIVLPPQCRTSSPHAESLEEEFVFVLKGSPHLWLNGYIYELTEGHAVGFPAGTGIAHTFINNSAEEVHLLVAGERTKADNLCSFPVNPELKEGCGIWWENPPAHPMGPHSGLPGPVQPEDFGPLPPDCLIHCPSEPRGKAFHYPGDNETFGEGLRISDRVGLKALGIWFERLPPGKRSAFPHAHTHEEEFVFVIEGNPTIWLDGFARQVEPGYFAAFPSNTGIAHVLINNTDEEVVYICVGEAIDFPGEKITYPLNDLRRLECERKGFYWTDAPVLERGRSSPGPKTPFPNHIAFRPSPGSDFDDLMVIELGGKPIGTLQLQFDPSEIGVCQPILEFNEEEIEMAIKLTCDELAQDFVKRAFGS